jgi:Tfp pilus assembly PilM family ATPase
VHDANEFRAAQFSRTRNGEKLFASAIFPRLNPNNTALVPDEDELRWVRSMLARRGFVGKAVSILPDPVSCSSHILELPPIDDTAAKLQVARGEIAREKKCSPTDIQIGYWDLPSKGRTSESMVVSCDLPSLEGTLDYHEDAGLAPVAVDFLESALVRAIGNSVDCDGIVGILHVGWDESLAVIANNRGIVYVRKIDRGLSEVHSKLTGQFNISTEAANNLTERVQLGQLGESERLIQGVWNSLVDGLVEDLDVAIRYVSHAYRGADLSSILVSGYGATHPEMLAEIDAVLGMDVRPLVNPILKNSELSDAECSRLAVPAGLAMRFDNL